MCLKNNLSSQTCQCCLCEGKHNYLWREEKCLHVRPFVNFKFGQHDDVISSELGPCFIHPSVSHRNCHGTGGTIFGPMNDQWHQQISFNTLCIQASASCVSYTQTNKTLPPLLRKFISMVFQ